MFKIASFEFSFIFMVLIFYGFLFLLYTTNGNSLYGLNISNITYSAPPTPTNNTITDFLSSTVYGATNIWAFFSSLFITPFSNGAYWSVFAFINWAIFGTMLYIFFRAIRGGG